MVTAAQSGKKMAISKNMRTFYTLLLTQTLSIIGSRISSLAVGIWVFNETGNATPLTLVAFFLAVPQVLVSGIPLGPPLCNDDRGCRSSSGNRIAIDLICFQFI
jgi:hypothetical protein